MPLNSTPNKSTPDISSYFLKKKTTNFFGMASQDSQSVAAKNSSQVPAGSVGGDGAVGGIESDVDLMSPLSPPGGVKRALSVGAPAAMSMSLRTVTSMIEEPLEPPPKGPRTDGERETMSQALKAVASHAASVCPVKVSGISVVPHKIPVKRSDKTSQAENRHIDGAIGAVQRLSRISESWDHSVDVNKTLYDDEVSEVDADEAGYDAPDQTLSELGDENMEEELADAGYGRGYDRASQMVDHISESMLRRFVVVVKEEMRPLAHRVETVAGEVATQAGINGEIRNNVNAIAEDVAGCQAAIIGIRNTAESRHSNTERQLDVIINQMGEMNMRLNEMERRTHAAEQTMAISNDAARAAQAAAQNAIAAKTEMEARMADFEALAQRIAALEAAPAVVPAPVGPAAGDGLEQSERDKLREIIRRSERDDISFWRRTMLVSGLSRNVSGRNVFNQARNQLGPVGLSFLVDEAERVHVTSYGNVRISFPTIATALDMLNSAKRALARFRGQHIRVELLVPPQFVAGKRELQQMGARMKSEREIDSYDVVMVAGELKLRTRLRGEPPRLYGHSDFSTRRDGSPVPMDVAPAPVTGANAIPVAERANDGGAAGEVQNVDEETCAICKVPNSHMDRLKIRFCGHTFCKNCLSAVFMIRGVDCPMCRQNDGMSAGLISCDRCQLENGQYFEPGDYVIASCGHGHLKVCHSEFIASKGESMSAMTSDKVEQFNNANIKKCYECDAETEAVWNDWYCELLRGTGARRKEGASQPQTGMNARGQSIPVLDSQSQNSGNDNANARRNSGSRRDGNRRRYRRGGLIYYQ